jgi:hypothetical protein
MVELFLRISVRYKSVLNEVATIRAEHLKNVIFVEP